MHKGAVVQAETCQLWLEFELLTCALWGGGDNLRYVRPGQNRMNEGAGGAAAFTANMLHSGLDSMPSHSG